MDTDFVSSDPLAREVALKLKCATLERSLRLETKKCAAATSAAATAAAASNAARLEAAAAAAAGGGSEGSSGRGGDGGGNGQVASSSSSSSHSQDAVSQLVQRALGQEKKLRRVTERMLRETAQAVSGAVGQREEQALVLQQAKALHAQMAGKAEALLEQEVAQAKHATKLTATGERGSLRTAGGANSGSGLGSGGRAGASSGPRDAQGRRRTVVGPKRMSSRETSGSMPGPPGPPPPLQTRRSTSISPLTRESPGSGGKSGMLQQRQREQQTGRALQQGRRGHSVGRAGVF
mmetsp:Transcript_53192/g.98936  ORF Transcript_53192/g.98936 Transcript_53192/m.98936 type:complete len:292 (+) Transcript_53192:1944-2819(+)